MGSMRDTSSLLKCMCHQHPERSRRRLALLFGSLLDDRPGGIPDGVVGLHRQHSAVGCGAPVVLLRQPTVHQHRLSGCRQSAGRIEQAATSSQPSPCVTRQRVRQERRERAAQQLHLEQPCGLWTWWAHGTAACTPAAALQRCFASTISHPAFPPARPPPGTPSSDDARQPTQPPAQPPYPPAPPSHTPPAYHSHPESTLCPCPRITLWSK